MPIRFELDQVTRTVHVSVEGVVTDAELSAATDQSRDLFAAGKVDTTWVLIADTTNVESLDGVTTDGLRRAAQMSAWPSDALRIIVAPSDLVFGLGRMFEMHAGDKGANIVVVRSEEEALAKVLQNRLGV